MFAFVFPAQAAVIINEISPNSDPEWIELYNPDTITYDLTDWILKDGNTNSSDDLTLTGEIVAGSYLVFTHPKGWLNDSSDGDTVTLIASDSAQIDFYAYTHPSQDKTFARVPTGSTNWAHVDPTQGVANPTPIPSPLPSPSPSPTSTPSPTPSPSPSPSPTPTPTPSPTPKPSPKLSPSPSPDLDPSPEGTVAGETTEIDLSAFGVTSPVPSATPPTVESGLTLRTDRLKNLLMIGGGLVIVSIASYFGYRKYLSARTISS